MQKIKTLDTYANTHKTPTAHTIPRKVISALSSVALAISIQNATPLSQEEWSQDFNACVFRKDHNMCQKLINNGLQSLEECTKTTCNDNGLIYQNAGFQAKAITFFKRAIDLDDNRAYHNLGLLYHKEIGNIPQAKKFYELALQKKHNGARLNLGTLYYEQKDFSNALKHFEIVCEKSSGEAKMLACHNLGVMYDNGEGTLQDYRKSHQYYKISCDMGYGYACNNLGVLYANGLGTKQNLHTAKELYGKACNLVCNKGCANYKALNQRKF